jgi:hypothetical protein
LPVRVLSSWPSGHGFAAVFFFFVATLIAGSTWWAMPAIAAPPAGAADACEAMLNETADAAARANKVIFICFLPVMRESPQRRTRQMRRRPPCEPVLSSFSLWLAVRFAAMVAAEQRGERTMSAIYILRRTGNFPPSK